MSDSTDNELALAASEGDRRAFATLAERHYDRVFRLAWRWSGTEQSAQDIAQDVMVKLAVEISRFRREARFSTWLHAIAYTTAIDHLRARQRIVTLAPSDMQALAEAPSGENPESNVLALELWQAVRSLPDQQRDAVLLVYGEDLSHQEAALIMGCTEKTVSWHVHEARKRLRAKLETVG